MRNYIVPALLAATALLPLTANAETKEITVAVTYDKVLLQTDEGAASVMESIKKQAKAACASETPITKYSMLDRTCMNDVVTGAMKKILEKEEVAGLEVAPAFARQTVTLVADAGQR